MVNIASVYAIDYHWAGVAVPCHDGHGFFVDTVGHEVLGQGAVVAV